MKERTRMWFAHLEEFLEGLLGASAYDEEQLRRRVIGLTRGGEKRKGVGEMAKDPVCGMTVDEEKVAATSEYKGKTYYFCSKGCKVAFDKDPEKYLQGEAKEMHGMHH